MLTFAQFPIPDILYIVWKITRDTFIFDYVFSSIFRTLHTAYVLCVKGLKILSSGV
jgi:hypothetical protein